MHFGQTLWYKTALPYIYGRLLKDCKTDEMIRGSYTSMTLYCVLLFLCGLHIYYICKNMFEDVCYKWQSAGKCIDIISMT